MLGSLGERLTGRDRDLLLRHASSLHGAEPSDQGRLLRLFDLIVDGFLQCAARGKTFVPIEAFEPELADSLAANYPGAGPAFLRLASSYWTLRMLEGRVSLRYAGIALQQLLASVEDKIAEAFFTDPAEDLLSSDQRAVLQRRMWVESGASIDVDEFLVANPLLVGNPLADG